MALFAPFCPRSLSSPWRWHHFSPFIQPTTSIFLFNERMGEKMCYMIMSLPEYPYDLCVCNEKNDAFRESLYSFSVGNLLETFVFREMGTCKKISNDKLLFS